MADSLVHLASASPRRRDILASLGICHSWEGVDIDETPLPDEPAAEMALRLALNKARESRRRRGGDVAILGADTVVALDARLFGKPSCRKEGLAMLSELSGRVHKVFTAVVLGTASREVDAISATDVRFRRIEPEEALRYWDTGEPADKAGAYAIQGLGGMFVEKLTGSWSGVVGLPVFETARLLREIGIDVLPAGASSRRS
ncbi:MAG: Maf family protein [Woeseia sp.]